MNFVPLLIWMFACGSDNEVRLQKTVRTELNTYDVGSAPFGSRTNFLWCWKASQVER